MGADEGAPHLAYAKNVYAAKIAAELKAPARIVLSAADCLGNTAITAEFVLTGQTVGKWRKRYGAAGASGSTMNSAPGPLARTVMMSSKP